MSNNKILMSEANDLSGFVARILCGREVALMEVINEMDGDYWMVWRILKDLRKEIAIKVTFVLPNLEKNILTQSLNILNVRNILMLVI